MCIIISWNIQICISNCLTLLILLLFRIQWNALLLDELFSGYPIGSYPFLDIVPSIFSSMYCIVDYCLSFCRFFFCDGFVDFSSTYEFLLSLWNLLSLLCCERVLSCRKPLRKSQPWKGHLRSKYISWLFQKYCNFSVRML